MLSEDARPGNGNLEAVVSESLCDGFLQTFHSAEVESGFDSRKNRQNELLNLRQPQL